MTFCFLAGALLRAEITLDKDTGISKGFGFVSFTTAEEVRC